MMWVESVLMVCDQVVDAAEMYGWRLNVGAGVDMQQRMLLAHSSLPKIRLAAPPTAR